MELLLYWTNFAKLMHELCTVRDVVGKTSVIKYLFSDGGCQEQLFTAPRKFEMYQDTSSTRHCLFPKLVQKL